MRANSTTEERRAAVLEQYCYRCQQPPGFACLTPQAGRATAPHVLRIYALRRARKATEVTSAPQESS